jgi:repressor LexA
MFRASSQPTGGFMYSLTEKQADLLQFIRTYMAEKNIAPSCDEMRVHMGLNAKSGIHRLLVGLEERGHIKRLKHHARAIKILEDK